jgi:hypothetical protein
MKEVEARCAARGAYLHGVPNRDGPRLSKLSIVTDPTSSANCSMKVLRLRMEFAVSRVAV